MRARGFTLVELVTVIVLVGILGVGVTGYIRTSVEAYNEITRRDELAQTGRFVIERVSRELRRALPGSVRVNGTCVEFMPTLAGSTYFQSSAQNDAPISPALAAATFDVVDFKFTSDNSVTYYAVIYPLENADVYAGAPGLAVLQLQAANAVAGNGGGVVRAVNLLAANTFPEQSPTQRMYIATQPISFCVVGSDLLRYESYGFNDPQASPPAGGVLLAERIQLADGGPVTPFSFTPGTPQRSGIVSLDFRILDRDGENELIRFSHDVAVRNAP